MLYIFAVTFGTLSTYGTIPKISAIKKFGHLTTFGRAIVKYTFLLEL